MLLADLFEIIQKACLPGVWSKGVTLTRGDAVILDSAPRLLAAGVSVDSELIFRVRSPDHPVSRKVTLWPEDEDWFCDCGGPNEVCFHVAAVVVTLKTGKIKIAGEGSSTGAVGDSSAAPASSPSKVLAAQILYRFMRHDGSLLFERRISQGPSAANAGASTREEVLSDTLVSFAGGISSGRIRSLPLAATKEDYAVDYALGDKKRGELDRVRLIALFKALSGCSNISLDQKPIGVSPKPLQIKVRLVDAGPGDGAGFRLQQVEESSITETFRNGAVLCGETLRGIELPALTPAEREMLGGSGKFFAHRDAHFLVSEVLPTLTKKIPVEIITKKLPRVVQVKPRIVLNLEVSPGGETLSVVPSIAYGDGNTRSHRFDEIQIADPEVERMLIRKLQNELQLTPGQTVRFQGQAAIDFNLRLQGWDVAGNGAQAFTVRGMLSPNLRVEGQKFEISFNMGAAGGANGVATADPKKVFQAWRENQSSVPLLGGGWATLPQDWLARYGERISALLEAKGSLANEGNISKGMSAVLPAYLMPEVGALCDELDQPYPDALKNLKHYLNHIEEIREAPLPADLTATLRHYQKTGVNWLSFLRDAKMGAMLADDMGLGKTLQALCAIRGRTLIIAPTSVLHSWADQIQKFRPLLSASLYYGAQRRLDKKSDIVITTYALLRLDREELVSQKWETIILDEAQIIKNPESQVARAAHSLRAEFRMTLSGTPIENRLDDLWSQFQFLNPGLLGSRSTFQDQFAFPICKGDQPATQLLRDRIKPFILRRLKREVAPELPPRTETVLYCELSSEEQEVYDSVLASARKEVLEKLELGGGTVFAALEILLRLRQACCHIGLVPGAASVKNSERNSSKVELLVQTLEASIAGGHRALIFSQWTSFLDLIEPALQASGISFSRLDGTTKNRQEVVADFQNHATPQVMLISLKAGGVGLTLTAADHIFLMDPWWNPAVEDQAADRAHRIGQTNPVLIHRLVAQNTIEDRILELQKLKVQMASTILENTSSVGTVSREDILLLLGLPLGLNLGHS